VNHSLTAWLPILSILSVVAALGLHDGWLLLRHGDEATLSVQTYRLCCAEPFLAFVMGAVLAGLAAHILWPHRG
jgi:hypothetical protein